MMTEVKRERKGFKMKEGKGFLANFKKIGGMDLWMYAVCAVLVGATVTTGAMSNDLMAYIAICLAVSLLLHRIGKCFLSGILTLAVAVNGIRWRSHSSSSSVWMPGKLHNHDQ